MVWNAEKLKNEMERYSSLVKKLEDLKDAIKSSRIMPRSSINAVMVASAVALGFPLRTLRVVLDLYKGPRVITYKGA